MSKELEALKSLKENHLQFTKEKYSKVDVLKSILAKKEIKYRFIEQALIQKAKQDKILDILKKKVVNLDDLHSQIQLYEQDNARALRAYNAGRLSKYQLTEEEYDLLKEWLKDD